MNPVRAVDKKVHMPVSPRGPTCKFALVGDLDDRLEG
jgi:hypothetical protein